ncbi:YceI family protein [Mycobacterium sp. IDR2000157661]|uniref:YceI family protein n=1 Tax=Mycobacterium sp. IDR2000157661 TaxID=2867005 RepID=UPI001EEC971F|nr:YceI family protein [Mycobacterium sp. IDR2000157661]ULE34079.1 YceI family protein [Mycobacterium sp. IDR2000157661]
MSETPQAWHLDQSDGRLLVRTGVTGRAAKMGHRLTIAMNSWHAGVDWTHGEPTEVRMTVDVASLEVIGGEGGVTPLTGPEKMLARTNALKTLDVKRFPQITFETTTIERAPTGYRLAGTVQIHGTTRDCVVDLNVEESAGGWQMSGDVQIRQTEFGVKPYSMLMGAMKVADAVTVSFTAERATASPR